MAESIGEAVLDLRVRIGRFFADLRKAKAHVVELGKEFDRIGRKMHRLGLDLSLKVSTPIVAFTAKSLDAASDLTEIRNVVEVTFEDAAQSVEDWAERTADAMRRSRTMLLDFASRFGSFLKPMGVAPRILEPVSETLAQLAVDISSFRNLSEEEVARALFSGLAGETEAVRRLGINLNALALDKKLRELGFKRGVLDADESAKILARFLLILEQTRDAQGDVIRTQDSWANATRSLMAAIRDMFETVGNDLIPVFKPLLMRVEAAIRNFTRLSAGTREVLSTLAFFAAGVGPALVALGALVRFTGWSLAGLAPIPIAIKKVAVAFFTWKPIAAIVGVVARAFTMLRVAVLSASRAMLGAILGWPGVVLGVIAVLVAAFFTFRNTISRIFSKETWKAIGDLFRTALNNYIKRPAIEAVNSVIDSINRMISAINRALDRLSETKLGEKLNIGRIGLLERLELPETRELSQAARESFGNIAEQAQQDARDAINTVTGAVRGAINAVSGFARSVADKFGDLADRVSAFFRLEPAKKEEGGFDELQKQVEESLMNLQGVAHETTQEIGGSFNELGYSISDSIASAVVRGGNALKSLGNLAKSILLSIAEGFISSGISSLLEKLGFKGLFSSLTPRRFATGGRPPVGVPSIVGERGPELFVPDRPGTIIPNHKLGGTKIEQRFNFPLAFPPQLEAFVRNIAGPAGRDAALQVLRAQAGRI